MPPPPPGYRSSLPAPCELRDDTADLWRCKIPPTFFEGGDAVFSILVIGSLFL